MEVDDCSRLPIIQVGTLGPELEAQLDAKGFSLGHFPILFNFRR